MADIKQMIYLNSRQQTVIYPDTKQASIWQPHWSEMQH